MKKVTTSVYDFSQTMISGNQIINDVWLENVLPILLTIAKDGCVCI